MKTGPSALTPFLRSDAQGAVLAETMLDPSVELSFAAVARRAGVLPAVAHRELTRLIKSDVLHDRRDGNNRLVRANTEHPLWHLMSELVIETYGPVPVLRALLADLSGVDESYIYGSWAARRSGELGPPPRDLDVMVVGTASRTELLDVADSAGTTLHTEVNIHRTSPEAWHVMTDPFLVTVASRPIVQLTGAASSSRTEGSDEQQQ